MPIAVGEYEFMCIPAMTRMNTRRVLMLSHRDMNWLNPRGTAGMD